jgi:hypothetical protein
VRAVCGDGFQHAEDSVTTQAMRSAKNGDNESAGRGITPCARGDSLLKILAGAGKFADGLGRSPQLFSPGSASMFSPSHFWVVNSFEE